MSIVVCLMFGGDDFCCSQGRLGSSDGVHQTTPTSSSQKCIHIYPCLSSDPFSTKQIKKSKECEDETRMRFDETNEPPNGLPDPYLLFSCFAATGANPICVVNKMWYPETIPKTVYNLSKGNQAHPSART